MPLTSPVMNVTAQQHTLNVKNAQQHTQKHTQPKWRKYTTSSLIDTNLSVLSVPKGYMTP